jgi:hypothetical protein
MISHAPEPIRSTKIDFPSLDPSELLPILTKPRTLTKDVQTATSSPYVSSLFTSPFTPSPTSPTSPCRFIQDLENQ